MISNTEAYLYEKVEIPASLVADVVCKLVVGVDGLRESKVEWMLNAGMDELSRISRSKN